jgi:hypothetical protein
VNVFLGYFLHKYNTLGGGEKDGPYGHECYDHTGRNNGGTVKRLNAQRRYRHWFGVTMTHRQTMR